MFIIFSKLLGIFPNNIINTTRFACRLWATNDWTDERRLTEVAADAEARRLHNELNKYAYTHKQVEKFAYSIELI